MSRLRTIGHTISFAPATLGLVLVAAGCSSNSTSSTPPPAGARENTADLAALEQAADLQMEAYAGLLQLFTENGAKPLLDPSLDLGEKGSAKYEQSAARVLELLEQAASAYWLADRALASLGAKLPAEAKADFGDRIPFFNSLKGLFWDTTRGAAKEARDNVLAIVEKGGDNVATEVYDATKNLQAAGRLDLTTSRQTDQPSVSLGATKEEFFSKLKAGELDGKISMLNLHKDLTQDASTEYGAIAAQEKRRPSLDNAYKTGASAVAAGVDLLKETVGNVVHASVEKAAQAVEVVVKAEEKAKDAISWLKTQAEQKVIGRVRDFFAKKAPETPPAEVEQTGKDLAKAVRTFAQHTGSAGQADPTAKAFGEGSGTGAVELKPQGKVSGTILVSKDTARQAGHLRVRNGEVPAGKKVLVPSGEEVRAVSLGEGKAVAASPKPVAVSENQAAPLELPPPAAPTTPPPPTGDGVWMICFVEGHVACVSYPGDAAAFEKTTKEARDERCKVAAYATYYKAGPGFWSNEEACRSNCREVGTWGTAKCDTPP
ncbi:MAG: hypothetical protein IT371_09175 [Deltaproteobacteria bacterium]|nr:hypothetical protein [Deltaproteobacteria bacterium]